LEYSILIGQIVSPSFLFFISEVMPYGSGFAHSSKLCCQTSAARKLRFGNSVLEEVGRVRENELSSSDEEPVGEADYDQEEEETDFEYVS